MSAPCSSSNLNTSALGCTVVHIKAVSPLLFLVLTFAPFAIKNLIISIAPLQAALIKSVPP